ncbi:MULTISPECIES: four helix bundle protein [unclassified Wenzhouxiangella]|uniref:four helix bundle protein n=1 Tax=unclassified Wenzhouxiangella TaxID=2613841 RepID=UPI002161AF39|nr:MULTISPECIES: four helix bundle protein [unclassified Wenzhouxiangella]
MLVEGLDVTTKPQHYQLEVWKRSMRMVRAVYEVTASFPDEERYCLTAQMRRCAISVPSNIAEGAARSGNKEFVRYLIMARGSLMELDTQTWIAKDLGYIAEEVASLQSEFHEILAMLNGLIRNRRVTPAPD